jgi:phosphoribosylamine---glycine ligase
VRAHRGLEGVRENPRSVVKYDGLAAGKGVVVPKDVDEAVGAVRALGAPLVIEERLEGEEVSVLALCDGERYLLLPPAQDHKRVFDGDQGPNTGGMGAYAPAPFPLPEIGERVIAPVLRELKRRGTPYRGVLYAGLMLTRSGPKVIEYNCRFGDPETQVLMMQLDDDLLPVLDGCARGRLEQTSLFVAPGASIGVVLAAEGYPGAPKAGDAIEGLDQINALVFHAGTRREGEKIVTAGGRVLTVCTRGRTLQEARDGAYAACERISFRGMHYRKDIGARAL